MKQLGLDANFIYLSKKILLKKHFKKSNLSPKHCLENFLSFTSWFPSIPKLNQFSKYGD